MSKHPNRHLNAWRKLCAETKVGGIFPLAFSIDPSWHVGRLVTKFSVPDAFTGAPVTITHSVLLPPGPPRLDFLRETAMWCYRHELEEQFIHAGSRPYYPEHEHT